MKKKLQIRFISVAIVMLIAFMLSFSFTIQSIAIEILSNKNTVYSATNGFETDDNEPTINNFDSSNDDKTSFKESSALDNKDKLNNDTSSTVSTLLKNTAKNVDETAKTNGTIKQQDNIMDSTAKNADLRGATARISVLGYAEGSLWYTNTDSSLYSKPLSITSLFSAVDEGKEYKIRITLKRQMKFVSYPWNDSWSSVSSEIPGSPYNMPSDALNLLKDNKSEFNNNGTPKDVTDDTYSLIYTLNKNTTLFNQDSGMRIMPDVNYTYDHDVINNAVKVDILDYKNNIVYTDAIDVTVDEQTANLLHITNNTAISGLQNQLLYNVYTNTYIKNSSVEFEIYSGTEANKTYPKNPNITVKSSTGTTIPSEYNSKTGILTVNFDLSTPELYRLSIYGDLTEPGFTNGYNIAPKKGFIKAYDGINLTFTNSPINELHILGTAATPNVIQPVHSNVLMVNQQHINNDVNSSGHPNRMHDLSFFAFENSTADEIITYDFTNMGVNIIGVYFPSQNGSLKNINVTFDNNTTYTMDSYSSNYISMAEIKAAGGSKITGAYIKTITANCGKFSKGWNGKVSIIGCILNKTNNVYGSIYSGSNRDTKLCDLSLNGGIRRYTSASMDVKAYEYDKTTNTFGDLKTTFLGGESIGTRVTFNTALDGILEPKLYLTTPYAFSLRSDSIKIYQDSVEISPDNIHINQFPVTNGNGIVSFNCYEIYATGATAAAYDKNGAKIKKGLTFELAMDINEAVTFNNFRIYDFFCFRLGTLSDQNIYLYPDDYENSNFQYDFEHHWVTGYDIYDIDFDFRISNEETLTKDDSFITTVPYTNLSVHGYVTYDPNTEGPGIYDPGVDGSSDVNVLTMKPDKNVFVTITVANPSTSVGTAKIKAYFPIPKAKIVGNKVIPQNADNTFKHYQFYDYKWPMSLAELPKNPDATIFDMIYYTGTLTLGENGEPLDTGNTVINPWSVADIPGGLGNVSMVAVVTKDGVNVPGATIAGIPSIYTFNAKLSIDINTDEVHKTGVNNKKNIIRCMFWRETLQGAGYIDTGYVAVRLSNGGIEGVVFEDSNHNGIRDANEATLDNVTVDVYHKSDTAFTNPLDTEITGTDGLYHIHGLENGSYVARVHNPFPHTKAQADSKRFAKRINRDSSKFKYDSDAIADDNHDYAIIPFDIPSHSVESEHNMNLGIGFEPPISVTIKNNDTSKGIITINGENVDSDKGISTLIWSGDTLIEPTIKAETGYEFMGWTINGEYYNFSTPINFTSEVMGDWKVRLYINLTYEKYLDTDGNGKADSMPKNVTEPINIGSTVNINLDGGMWNETETTITLFEDRLIFSPSKEGYVFAGWVLENAGNNSYTLTAKWEIVESSEAAPKTYDTNRIFIMLGVWLTASLFIIIILNKKRTSNIIK